MLSPARAHRSRLKKCLQDVCFCSRLSLRCPPATRPGGLLSLSRPRLIMRQQHDLLPP